ncbi:alpha/beta hydrolase-fold protein [Maribellus mangrovi]|uniref:alpha/beta hydrolase-fold protein n=1 Tax=Maribellus mangrovi TaxID=3133146 RepID=UPI0030EECE57
MKKVLSVLGLMFLVIITVQAQNTWSLKVNVTISENVLDQFKPEGRLFLFASSGRGQNPRMNTWPNLSNKIFAINLNDWNSSEPFVFDASKELTKSVDVNLDALPEGTYKVQVLWDQNLWQSGINEPGNLFSQTVSLDLNEDTTLDVQLEELTEAPEFTETEFLKLVDIKSDAVSEFWGKEIRIKAAIVLPSGYYKNPDATYPVRYNIAGYGGRYTRATRMVLEGSKMEKWWMSDEAPQIINVFLDGYGPFGDCYQMDSENSGPYGVALTEELIPYIEKEFRAVGTPESRYLDGCSTGGYVSLSLQIYYPDFFNGCFSYSADEVDFEYCQLMNIYKDENAYINEYGYLRPIMRDVNGEPIVSQKDFIYFENVLSPNDSYVNSGGQFSAFSALFTTRGADGLPKALFDPVSGNFDKEVVKEWEKHDLKRYVENNWETLGPKLQEKLWIWMGDMDNFYLNPPMRSFDRMLKEQTNPESDAVVTFVPMMGHCRGYDPMDVLNMIAEKWAKVQGE